MFFLFFKGTYPKLVCIETHPVGYWSKMERASFFLRSFSLFYRHIIHTGSNKGSFTYVNLKPVSDLRWETKNVYYYIITYSGQYEFSITS